MRAHAFLIHLLLGIGVVASTAVTGTVEAQPQAVQAPRPRLAPVAAAASPMLFEPNLGQADSRVRFLARGAGQALFLADSEAMLLLPLPRSGSAAPRAADARAEPTEVLALRIAFAGRKVQPSGRQPRQAAIHHRTGADRSKWRNGIPAFAEVVYPDLYPGIDLVVRPGARALAYDFHLAPRADARSIRLRYPGADGLSLGASGDLLIRIAGREIRQSAPLIYQDGPGGRERVPGGYSLRAGNEVGFRIGSYDRRRPLVIDPVIDISTLYGGGDHDSPGISGFFDSPDGSVFAAGTTLSSDLYLTGLGQNRLHGSYDAFVTKFDAATFDVVYSTYLPGSSSEGSPALSVDTQGRAYVTAYTRSTDLLPADAPPQTPSSMFVARLDPSGQPDYIRYVGESTLIDPRSILIRNDRLIIAGETGDPAFATTPLIPGLPPPGMRALPRGDAFIATLDAANGQLLDARYIGGSERDSIFSLATDASGAIYAVGLTESPDFPRAGVDPDGFHGGGDAFVLKLPPSLDGLLYSTLVGGSGWEYAIAVAIDGAGRAHITGMTRSTDLPQILPIAGTSASATRFNAHYAAVDASGRVVRSSYVGTASLSSIGHAVAAGLEPDTVWISGTIDGAPVPSVAENSYAGGYDDGYLIGLALDPGVTRVVSWRFLGGNRQDGVSYVSVRPDHSLVVAGYSDSTNFPATLVRRNGAAGTMDIFIARLLDPTPLGVTIRDSRDPVRPDEPFDYEVTVSNDGTATATGVTLSLLLPPGCTPIPPLPASCSVSDAAVSCAIGTLPGGESTAPPLRIPVACSQPGNVVAVATVFSDVRGAATARERTTVGSTDLLVTVEPVDAVTRQPLSGSVATGQPVGFRTTVRNVGLVATETVLASSEITPGCTFIDPPAAGGTANFTLPAPLAPAQLPGDRATIDITVRCAVGLQRNTVRVSTTNEPAPQSADGNTAHVDIYVLGPPNLIAATEALDLVHHQPIDVLLYDQDPVLFRASVRNYGASPASAVTLQSTVTPGCISLDNPGTTTLTKTTTLAPMGMTGDRTDLLFYVKCATGLQRNTVIVSSPDEPMPESADGNQAHLDLTFLERPILNVELAAVPDHVRVGRDIDFRIDVVNVGHVVARNIDLAVTFTGDGHVLLYSREVPQPVTCGPVNYTNPAPVSFRCAGGDLNPGQRRFMLRLTGTASSAGMARLSAGVGADGARATASVLGRQIDP